MRVGVYPGSFNPPTVAHLAIAEAAVERLHLTRIDLVVSRQALGKGDVERPLLRDRMRVLHAIAAHRPWLGIKLSEQRLLADIAEGYDVLVLGADKWAQISEVKWYASTDARDAALARLPHLAVVPRSPYPAPTHASCLSGLEIDGVSSTGVRERGEVGWMAPEAAEFAAVSGAWVEPARYERWLVANPA